MLRLKQQNLLQSQQDQLKLLRLLKKQTVEQKQVEKVQKLVQQEVQNQVSLLNLAHVHNKNYDSIKIHYLV